MQLVELTHDTAVSGQVARTVAIRFNSRYGETFYSFVNVQYTSDGGTHFSVPDTAAPEIGAPQLAMTADARTAAAFLLFIAFGATQLSAARRRNCRR